MRLNLKIFTKAVLTAALLLAPQFAARSQIIDYDPISNGQQITGWITDVEANAQQLWNLAEKLKLAKEDMQKLKDTWNRIEPFINAGKQAAEILRATERVMNAAQAAQNYVEWAASSGYITRLSTINTMVDYVLNIKGQIEGITQLIRSFLDTNFNLTSSDRKKLTDDAVADLDAVAQQLEDFTRKEEQEMLQRIENAFASEMLNAAIRPLIDLPDRGTASKTGGLMSLSELSNAITESVTGETMDTSTGDTSASFSNRTVQNVFNFVTIVIGLLGSIMIVWGFARRSKDPQHHDALWKALIGLVFVLLMLQFLKVFLFGGFVNMTIPNF